MELYKTAIEDKPFSFLYIDLMQKEKENMFYARFAKRLLIET